jgi:hypothetical protein
MAFLGPNDMLVLEKEKGTVQRIVNGQNISQPLLDVNVAGSVERGMLGIAVSKDTPGQSLLMNRVTLTFMTLIYMRKW